jgi:hypothetical protein
MAPVTRTLILVNVVAFCFERIFGDAMIVHLACAGQRRKQALGVDDPAHAGVDAGLRRFRDGERRPVAEGGEVLHVEGSDAERHYAQQRLDEARVPEHEDTFSHAPKRMSD